jgi:hypothetical protein
MSIVKLNNQGVKNATAFGSISSLGSMVFIKKITISSPVSSVQFVDGSNGVVLDDTYKEYLFTFNNLHPNSNSEPDIKVNFSTDGGSNYNATKTTTAFYARHAENNDFASLAYIASDDLAQSTSNQFIANNMRNNNDASCVGYMHLFNPSSTTYVKHFIMSAQYMQGYPASWIQHYGGYINSTSAVDAVSFIGEYGEGTSGNIDAGDICLYGIA